MKKAKLETNTNFLSIININLYDGIFEPDNFFDDEDFEYFDFKKYKESLKKQFEQFYKKEINPRLNKELDITFIKALEFYSPKAYNYEKDSISFELEYTQKTIKTLRDWIKNGLSPKVLEYIDNNYKSCSGFISFVEPNFLENIEENLDLILELYCLDWEFQENFIYDCLENIIL